MKIFLRRKHDGACEISDQDDGGNCHICKSISIEEFDQAVIFYCDTQSYDVSKINDDDQSAELYEINIRN